MVQKGCWSYQTSFQHARQEEDGRRKVWLCRIRKVLPQTFTTWKLKQGHMASSTSGETGKSRHKLLSLAEDKQDLSPKAAPGAQFSPVAQSCPTLCDPMSRSAPGLPVHHQLPEFTQTHVHQVGDAIQPPHPLSSPSPAPNPSQHQGLFQWVNSSHDVAKVLEFWLQHQSFQWTPRTDFL